MRYLSLFSGIEAATVAWDPLGFKPVAFAEIEPFPSAILAERYPGVPNLGDVVALRNALLRGEDVAGLLSNPPDIVVGGSPCQAFSVAGSRSGLSCDRGNLTLVYAEIIHAIKPRYIVWENVPGVLSMRDNAFGHLLGALAGEDGPLVPPGEKWTHAGAVSGPERNLAWRVLDAQYFGVAQQRRRVFLIGSRRDGPGPDPWEILFEWEGVRRDTPPRREAGETAAGTLASRTGAGGFPRTDRYKLPETEYPNPICFNSRQDPIVTWDRSGALTASTPQAESILSVVIRGRDGEPSMEMHHDDVACAMRASHGGADKSMAGSRIFVVRRLMPFECARLQGFPDDYLDIWCRGKPVADGPKYKALGNSMAVPVMRWIGERVQSTLR
jgi:DNA (cytosine-5)-methyltransferase 1